ncbi:MAG: LL-diaminopimelate aminotransferase [Peptococcaceae bacterium]|jgi:LL-diaminopimelate aminotransferase|nr:LL-diaminopimelate aminotransferase [Peptococcaceae bacterium]
MKVNENFSNLATSYLFTEVARRQREYTAAHPDAEIIRLSIGDVTRPLVPVVIDAMTKAVAEMGKAETFHGYGDEQGYGFLREAIVKYYAGKGVELALDEIFISDGAKSDVGNILNIFSTNNIVAVPDPVYPVYVDTNIMDGRKVVLLDANAANGFLPMPGEEHVDIIYICSPNNPTGAVYNREQLTAWVEYALAHDAVILFDAAYEAFINDPVLPTSIYQIPGAEKCAIELCSLSKTAGFTGTRCGYTIVPKALVKDGASLNAMWLRRQTTKFNGVPYIVQRGAEAVFTPEGMAQCKENIAHYRENAKVMGAAFDKLGISYCGGVHSPYIWLHCPDGLTSWEYFDVLLEQYHIVVTPGSGFGKNGEGYLRLTAFNTAENTKKAMERLTK